MSAIISNVKRQSDGMVTLTFRRFNEVYAGQIWMRCKARKHTTCAVTDVEIKPGDMAYRPMTNAHNRMYRIAAAVLD